MSTLRGKSISKTYQRILQTPSEISNEALRDVQTGGGISTAMKLSTTRAEFLLVGIGTGGNTQNGMLHVLSTSAGSVSASTSANEGVFEGSSDSGISILSGGSSVGSICFGDEGDNDAGKIAYDHSADSFVVLTGGTESLRLDSSGNLNVSGNVNGFDTRYKLEEYFEKVPSQSLPSVSQSTNATTAVTLNAKFGLITMQSHDLAATDTVEFTFNNDHIYGANSQVLVNINEAGTVADNAMVNIMVHDVADGSCKVRIGTNGTDVAAGVFKLFFIIDPYITPNQNFILTGTNVGTATRVANYPGITITTLTSDNDSTVLIPRDATTEMPGGIDSSAWSAVNFGTDHEIEFSANVMLPSSFSNTAFFAGMKLTVDPAFDTDADSVYFLASTNDDLGSLTTNANLHFVHSIAGLHYVTNLGINVEENVPYNLRFIIDADRKATVFVNNVKKGLATLPTGVIAGGSTQSNANIKSAALTDAIDFIPMVGVRTLTTSAKSLNVGSIKISRSLTL
tara:strand:- start:12 stop:1541 length:1530 start_codon:yes stop_codon:yes gene_type:complete